MEKYRIKIETYKDGSAKYIPQYKEKGWRKKWMDIQENYVKTKLDAIKIIQLFSRRNDCILKTVTTYENINP